MKFTYPAIIRKQDNGTWKAWLPDLACCEAVGDTLDDAIEEASIRVLVDKFQSKNQIRTKIAVEIIVLILSIAVFIVGGIMVTANSAGQISAALKLPMQVYYVCIPISGCLMVLYCLERLKRWFIELKEGK